MDVYFNYTITFILWISLKQVLDLDLLLRAVNGYKMAKSQGTRKENVRPFHPVDHTQRPAEENWPAHLLIRRQPARRKSVSRTFSLCRAFHLRSPCQVSTTYVTCTCQVRVTSGSQEELTAQERALLHTQGVSICLLKVILIVWSLVL